MWPFKTKEKLPLYKIVEAINGSFWVEKLFDSYFGRKLYLKITPNFQAKEDAQHYIANQTPKKVK